jgi:hypothetical protein
VGKNIVSLGAVAAVSTVAAASVQQNEAERSFPEFIGLF